MAGALAATTPDRDPTRRRGVGAWVAAILPLLLVCRAEAVVAPPSLSGGLLAPPEGDTATSFAFSVTYTNGTNAAPDYAYLVLVRPDGSKWWRTMTTTDPTPADGSLYTYSCTLPVGGYSYYFQFLAGAAVLKTATVSGPTVHPPPSLSGAPASDPVAGDATAVFRFTAAYTNWTNAAPGYAYLILVRPDGTKWWRAMTTTDPTPADGSLYTYSCTLPVGGYSYYFQFLAGATVLKTATLSGPTVHPPPSLSGAPASDPVAGDATTVFRFSAVYTNWTNAPPGYAYLVLVKPDGSKWWRTMTTTDPTPADGSLYAYSCTLPVGGYSYYFQFLAGATVLKTATVSGPTVLPSPSLSGGSLAPPEGDTSASFAFSVTYTNAANTDPGYAYVVVVKPDGSKWWKAMTTGDLDYTDGSRYSYSGTLPAGAYSYYFQFAAGAAVLKSAPVSGPTVHAPDASAMVLFLHHSTGGVIWNGGVPAWLAAYNATHATAYQAVEQAFPKASPYGWANYPYDYWNIWVAHAGMSPYKEEPTLEMLAPDNDVIVFKHCFPVSNIEPDTGTPNIASAAPRLENYYLQYAALKAKMREFPDTRFIVWTGAALTAGSTTEANAQRARQFFEWVRDTWDEPGDNIFVWDLFELETDGGLYLKDAYAASAGDSHPNAAFAQRTAPLFAQRLVDVIEGRGDSGSVTGASASLP